MLRQPADDEIRATFEDLLASVCSGGGICSGTGLNMKTVTGDLVAAARAEPAAQLDGSHSAARRAALQRRFDELAREANDRRTPKRGPRPTS